MSFEQWVESIGIDPALLTEEGKAAMQLAFDAMNKTGPGEPAAAAAGALINLRGARAADLRRIAQIEAVASSHPMIAAKAIEAGWTVDQTELEILRASRPKPPSAMRRGAASYGDTPQHLSAALMVRAGYASAAEQNYGPAVMEQSRHLHAASIVDLCRAGLQADGRDCPHDRGAMLRAALSTGSMPIALGDSANKILISAYRQAPAAWRSFAAVKSVPDFKVATGIRPSFAGDLEVVPGGGEIKHGSYSEETYQWQVTTYAKQFQIDRRDIIDDDLSAFSEVIPGLARSAARTLNGLVATVLLANTGSFFSTGNSNFFADASANLQASSLATAIQMLRQMKDADGNLLDLQPSVLLIPPELEPVARALIQSTEVSRIATSDLVPTGNVYKDFAQLAVEPRLSDSGYTGYSAVAWYLFSDAANSAVVVGFLDGRQEPVLEQFGLGHDINHLSYGFRCYHDFGAALADHRSAIKSKGAS